MWGNGVVPRGKILGSKLGSSRWYIAKPRQFILSKIDARHGAFGLVPTSLENAIVSNDFPLFDIDASILVPEYLSWLSKTNDFIDLCKRASEGTTNRVRLKLDRFLESDIPLPPLDEQRRIVAHIDALAARIAEARQLREAIVQEADEIVSALHLQLSGSRKVKVSDFLRLDEKQEPVQVGKEYPQVGVRGFGQGLFSKGATEGSQTSYRTFNRLYSGAVVLSQVKGWEGAVGVCPPQLDGWYVSPEYRTFSCIEGEASSQYLSMLIPTSWFWNKLQYLSRGLGGRRERVRPELFLELELPMPEIDLQRRLAVTLPNLEVLKRLQAETTAELDVLLPSVLNRAFKGELMLDEPVSLAEAFGMTERQLMVARILLGLARFDQGKSQPVRITPLMKHAFLVQKEANLDSEDAFHFIAHHYGPYTWELYRDLDILKSANYVSQRKIGSELRHVLNPQKISALQRLTEQLPDATLRKIDAIVQKYRDLSHNGLLHYVYEQYPEYTGKSERQDILRSIANRRESSNIAD